MTKLSTGGCKNIFHSYSVNGNSHSWIILQLQYTWWKVTRSDLLALYTIIKISTQTLTRFITGHIMGATRVTVTRSTFHREADWETVETRFTLGTCSTKESWFTRTSSCLFITDCRRIHGPIDGACTCIAAI